MQVDLTHPNRVYNCALALGSSFGVVIFGLVIRTRDWRNIFWILTAASAFCTLVMIFTIPETAYNRSTLGALPAVIASNDTEGHVVVDDDNNSQKREAFSEHVAKVNPTQTSVTSDKPRTPYFSRLWIKQHVYTSESIWLLMFRPVALLALPGVLWATLINSVTVGMLVVLTSNFSAAFETIYGFAGWQAGLTFVGMAIGSLIAIFFAGHFSDWVADIFTQRNGGVRIPEMRLPALVVSVIAGPLGCILYGVGFGLELHWICPVVGIALSELTTLCSGFLHNTNVPSQLDLPWCNP